MIIKLKSDHGGQATGSLHMVTFIVPHGGHSDDAKQFVLTQRNKEGGEIFVLESHAEVIVAEPEPPLYPEKDHA